MVKNIIINILRYFHILGGIGSIGRSSILKPFGIIWNKKYLYIGKNVYIGNNYFIAISKIEKLIPIIEIQDNSCIGKNFFIACVDKILIEKNVLISNNVFISDHIHGHMDDLPIKDQELVPRGEVKICEGAFLGINCVIKPGVTIGRNSIVDANSVVIKDVAPRTVVAGNPAKVIKYL